MYPSKKVYFRALLHQSSAKCWCSFK